MWLTRLFVNRPTLVTVTLLLVLLAGSIAGLGIVKQQFPSATVPSIEVVLSYPGASTTEMRDAVARPVEDQLAGSSNLDHLTTAIEPGQATLIATFTLDSDENNDLVQVQGRVQNAQRSLPNDIQPPQITVYNPSEAVVVSLAVHSHSLTSGDLSSLVINKIVPSLEQIPGVSFVQANGTVTPAIMVNVDPFLMQSSGATLTDLISTLSNNNIRSPGGILYSPNRETNLDVRGDIQDVPTVASLLLTGGSTNNGTATDPWQTQSRLLRVADVAKVEDSYETQRVFAYSHGEPCIALELQKSAQTSEVDTSNAILAALPELRKTYPDVSFDVLNIASTITQDQLVGVVRTLIEAILFTGVVMLFFLRSWRNALLVTIAIPTSLLVTLAAMRALQFTLDTVSLLAMTLIIGILVDDSIVVLENVERHLQLGEQPIDAAIRGRGEIGLAAIVITLVDVVVFLPISFLPGSVGLFLREFGLVVTVATLTSLFVSFTITPTLAARWSLRSTWRPWPVIERFTQGFEQLRSFYVKRFLESGLKHPRIVLAVALLTLLAALVLLPLGLVGYEYLPSVDRGEITLTLRYPSGTPIATTVVGTRLAEHTVNTVAEIRTESATAGAYRGELSGYIDDAAVGQIDIFLQPNRKRTTNALAAMLQKKVAEAVAGATVIAVPASNLDGGTAQPLDFIVSSRNGDASAAAAQVSQALRETPGAIDITSSAAAVSPQLSIMFDRDRARVLAASIGSGANAIAAAFGGYLATQFTGADGLKDVVVTYPFSQQHALAALLSIPLRTTSGSTIHLGDIITLTSTPAPPLIIRLDRKDVVYVGADVAPGYELSNVQRSFAKHLAALKLSDNISVAPESGGNQSEVATTLQGMSIALGLSTLLVYLLMVALYNDYRLPFIIMFSVPVAAVGALGALALAHETLNLFSLIGLVLLIGLVTKNGILLVDFAATRQRQGIAPAAAMRAAAQERFRPILMTTIAMIAGMLPLAFDLDPGAQAASSLGTVVIGGLVSSLLLTLVLVPVVFLRLAPQSKDQRMTEGNV